MWVYMLTDSTRANHIQMLTGKLEQVDPEIYEIIQKVPSSLQHAGHRLRP